MFGGRESGDGWPAQEGVAAMVSAEEELAEIRRVLADGDVKPPWEGASLAETVSTLVAAVDEARFERDDL